MTEEWPDRWRVQAIGEAGEVQLGRQRSPEHHSGPNMRPYLRVANVFDDRLDLSDVMEMNFTPAEAERFVLRPGDILLNEGQSKHLVGRPAMYRGELPGACFTNSLVRFRAHADVVPEFALAVFRHYLHSGRFQEIATITTNIAHLGATKFAMLPFPTPTLVEQRRIVAKLDALRARSRRAKEALDAVPALLDRLRQSILAAAFRGDLTADWREQNPDVEPASELLKRIRIERRKRWEEAELAKMVAKGKPPKDDRWKAKYVEPDPVDATDLPALPDGWCWASLSEVTTLQLGQRRAPEFKDEATYPYVRAANITWDGLDLADLKTMGFEKPETMFLEPGDVLLNEASGSPGEVGKAAVWGGEIPQCCYQATVLRLRPVHAGIDGRFLRLALLGDALLGRFVALAPGVGILHLTAERMRAWPVPLAPRGEQIALVARVEEGLAQVRRQATTLGESAHEITALDAAVLAAAFRGELLDRDAGDPSG